MTAVPVKNDEVTVTKASKVSIGILFVLIAGFTSSGVAFSSLTGEVGHLGETMTRVEKAVEQNTEARNGHDQALAIMRTTLEMMQRTQERHEARIAKLEGR